MLSLAAYLIQAHHMSLKYHCLSAAGRLAIPPWRESAAIRRSSHTVNSQKQRGVIIADQTILWQGASGKQYEYWISPLGMSFVDEPGNYIFVKETSPNNWIPIYIGETDSLKNRLADHEKLLCVRRNGGTHIHAHTTSGSQQVRKEEEADLLANWDPPCNKE